YVCDAGTCALAAGYCDKSADCPPGYWCNPNRHCELGLGVACSGAGDCGPGETCPSGTCVDSRGCTSSSDCPSGWTCDVPTGACVAPAGTVAIDVSGAWSTRYHFDLSHTLPGVITGMAPVVDFLDLVFRSQLQIDVPVLGDILEAVIDQVI